MHEHKNTESIRTFDSLIDIQAVYRINSQ